MPGNLKDIENITVRAGGRGSSADQPSGERDFEVRDRIVDRIREIAGKDSIKRIQPVQHQGDHQEQDISFDIGDDSYTATIRYNNALTEGWVTALRKYPKIC
ncbi:MAG: hypothetical protein A4E28_02229 [Methanocella sp. PtaU1.Bin125]|nr:MAG: hypothetical protein A4E28_02229 [Methanocella sp. PtaU1.Bin125]